MSGHRSRPPKATRHKIPYRRAYSVPVPPTSSRSSATPDGKTARLAWLDLLRGVAAMVVALHHATYYFTPTLRAGHLPWFDPGLYGVLVFFLVSGYIVPASLERHGQVRSFWISRITRIYPLLTVACAITVLPFLLGVRGLRAGLGAYGRRPPCSRT